MYSWHMSELRKCRVCGEEKESTEFRSPKQGTICLACSKKRTQEWQAANRDKMRANNKKYVDSIKSGERERREKIQKGRKGAQSAKKLSHSQNLERIGYIAGIVRPTNYGNIGKNIQAINRIPAERYTQKRVNLSLSVCHSRRRITGLGRQYFSR